MSNGLASLLRNPRRLQQFAETPGNYPAALSFAGVGQSRVAGRAAPRTSKSEEEAGVLETGEVIDKVKLPDGSYVRPATQSGQIVKVPGRSNLFVDPVTGEPFQADPAKPTGLRSAFETARKVARGGKLFAVVPGVGEREIGADPEAEKKAKEQAAKREAENVRLGYAKEKRPYNIDRVTGRPVPLQSDEEWAKAKQEKADKLAEAAAVKKLKAQADKLDIDADRLSLTTPKISPEEAAAYDAAVSSLEGFAAGKDLDAAAEELANSPDSEDEDQNAAKATAQSYLSLRDKVKPAKDAEAKSKELKLRALDLKEQMLDPDAWKAGKAASLAELPDADLAAEAKAQADIITEQETEAQGTLELVAKGRADLEQKHAAFMAERQAAEAQGLSLEQKQALDDQQAQLEAEMADYDDWNAEAVTSAQGSLKASQDRREVLAAAGAEIDRRNKATQEQFQAQAEKAAVLEKAKPLYDWAKDNFHYTDDYRGMNDYGILDAEAKKAGLDPKQAREALQTFRQLDWSNPRRDAQTGQPIAEESRLLPDGRVTINPGAWGDLATYTKAVDASGASEAAKKQALEQFPQLQEIYAEKAVDILSKSANIPGQDNFMKWRERKIEEDQAQKGALGFTRKSPARQAIEYMDEMKNRSWFRKAGEQIVSGLLVGSADIATQVLGDAAMLTGSETIADLAAANSANSESVVGAQSLEGSDTDYALRVMGMGARMAPGVAAMMAGAGAIGGGVTAASILSGAQTAGGMFADIYRKAKDEGMSHGEAWRKAALPSAFAGAITGLLTRGMGATGLERVFADPVAKEAAKGAFKAYLGQFAKAAAEELPEETADEFFSQIIQGAAESADPAATLKNYVENLPELAGVSALMGGAGGLMQGQGNATKAGPEGMAPLPAEPQAPAGPATTPGPVAPAQISQPAQTGDIAGAIKAFTPTGEAMLPQAVADTVKRTNRTTEDVSRAAASGLVKVAQGASLESLDAREREALGFVSKDGKIIPAPKTTPLVETYKGKLVIRNEAAEWLDDEGQPLLARQIRLDEAERKAQIDEAEAKPAAKKKAGQAKEKAAESQSQGSETVITGDSLSSEASSTLAPATTSTQEVETAAIAWDNANKNRATSEWFDGDKMQNRAFNEAANAGANNLQAHGMAKEATLTGAVRNLFKLLQNGVDPNRGGGQLYTAQLALAKGQQGVQGATSSGTAYRDGPFILVQNKEGSAANKGITDTNSIAAILVNEANIAQLDAIRKAIHAIRPDIIVAPYSQARQVTEQILGKTTQQITTANEPQPQTAVSPEPSRGQVMPESRELPVVPEQPPAPAQETAPEPEPAAGGGLTPAQQDQLARAEAAHKKRVETINKMESDPEQRAKQLKAEGMKHAAVKRQITGKLTAKESAAQAKREVSNYEGKPVAVEGRPAVVTGNAFGKVKVRFEDGTTKAVPASQVAARQEDDKAKKLQMSTVSPATDELLGTNNRNEPIYWSADSKTHYSITNGRVRTGPWTEGLPESALERLQALIIAATTPTPPAPVDEAAAQAATSPASPAPEPSEAQKEAGNYKKGHAKIGGLDISIENEAGTKRRPEWGALSDHYGYIKGTVDNTGEQADVFIKPGTPEDYAGPVFVVTQNDPKTGKFDEFKTIIGYDTAAEAELAYRSNYTADWQGFGGIQEMSLDKFKAGLADMTAREKAARQAPSQPEASQEQRGILTKTTNIRRGDMVEVLSGSLKGLRKVEGYDLSPQGRVFVRNEKTGMDEPVQFGNWKPAEASQETASPAEAKPLEQMTTMTVNVIGGGTRKVKVPTIWDKELGQYVLSQGADKLINDAKWPNTFSSPFHPDFALRDIDSYFATWGNQGDEQNRKQTSQNYRELLELAVQARKPVSAYGWTTDLRNPFPEGYVREGDLYVYRPAKAGQPVSQAGQAVSEQPAPATPLAKAKAAIADYTAKAKADKAAAKTQEAKNAANRKIVGAAWLAKRLEAFDGVVDYAVATEYNGKPIQGMMVIPAGRGGLFVINPAGAIDQLAENNLGKEALYKAIDKFLVHEFIHQAALSRLNDNRILDLYNALTPEAKAASRRLYLAQAGEGQGELDEFQAAHEWFAQLVEARMSGEISNQALIEASDDPAFRDKLAALFREFVAALREIAGLVKDPAMAEQIRAEADAVEAAVRQMAEKAGLATRQDNNAAADRAQAEPVSESQIQPSPTPATEPETAGQSPAQAVKVEDQPQNIDAALLVIDQVIRRYEDRSRPYEGGRGLAVGAENANDRIAADSLMAMKRAIRQGMSIDDALEQAKKEAREMVRNHNRQRPKDVNWQRWEGTADSVLTMTAAQAKRASQAPTPAQPAEQAAKAGQEPALPASVTPAQAEAVAEEAAMPYASPLAQFVGEWLGMNASQQSRVDMPQRVIRLAVNQADTEAVMKLVQDVGTKGADGQLLFNTPHQRIYNELREALRYTLRKGMGTEKDKVSTQLGAIPDLTPPQTAAVAKEAAMPEPAKQAAPFDAAAAKGQKKFLLAEVAKLVKDAPRRADMPDAVRQNLSRIDEILKIYANQEKSPITKERGIELSEEMKGLSEAVRRDVGTVTIEVPGDGTFTILNEKGALAQFQKRADKFPVSQYKDDLPAKPTAQAPTAVPALKKPKTTADVVAAIYPMVSEDQTRGSITSVKGDGTHLFATDGRVLARVEQENGGGKGSEAVIYDEKGNAQPWPEGERVYDGNQVIPDDSKFQQFDLDAGRWFSLMSQARAVIKTLPGEDENIYASVSIHRNPDGSLGVFASDVNRGDYAHNIQPGAKFIASYNPAYIQTILRVARNLGHETVEFRVKDDVSPATFRAPNAVFVLMPMRVSGAAAYSPEAMKAKGTPPVTAQPPAVEAAGKPEARPAAKTKSQLAQELAGEEPKDYTLRQQWKKRVSDYMGRSKAELEELLADKAVSDAKYKARAEKIKEWSDYLQSNIDLDDAKWRSTLATFAEQNGVKSWAAMMDNGKGGEIYRLAERLADTNAALPAAKPSQPEAQPASQDPAAEAGQGREEAADKPPVGYGDEPAPPAITAPGVRYNDIPLELARQAHRGTSFVPDVRARSEQRQYVAYMNAVWSAIESMATTEEQKAIAQVEFARYREKYLEKEKDLLRSKAGIVSSMIAGPSRFPVARMQKRNEAYHSKLEEFLAWDKKAKAKIANTINPQPPAIISSDLKNAPELLRQDIEDAKKRQEMMKQGNALIRKLGTDKAAMADGLRKLGFTDKEIASSLNPPSGYGLGWQSFTLTNNQANIRRMEQRLAGMEKLRATAAREATFEGGRVEENADLNRVQIFFDAKPGSEMIDKLKANGFKWAPSQGAWQRQRTNAAVYAAESVLGVKMAAPAKETPAEPEPADIGPATPMPLPADEGGQPGLANPPGGQAAVTPAQDAEYMAAVEAGDTDKAQRMVDEAAKNAGYDVGPVYHGTRRKFDVFVPMQPRAAYGNKPGIYFSPDIATAEEYAADEESGKLDAKSRVIKAYIRNAESKTSKLYGTTEYIIQNPNDAKLADPVTYDESGNVIPLSQRFNPASPSILYNPPGQPSPARQSDEAQAAELEEAANEAVREAADVQETSDMMDQLRKDAEAADALRNDPDAVAAVQASGAMSGRNLSQQFRDPAARDFYRALTAARDMVGGPATVVLDEMRKWAAQQVQADPDKAIAFASELADEKAMMKPEEQAVVGAVIEHLNRVVAMTGDKATRLLLHRLGNYYLDIGTLTAQALAGRRDPLETPQDRWNKALTVIFGPDSKVRRRLALAPTAAAKARRIAELEAQLAGYQAGRRADIEAALKEARGQETQEEILERSDAANEKLKANILKRVGIMEQDMTLSTVDRYSLQTAILELPAVREALDKFDNGRDIMRLAFRGFSDAHIAGALQINEADVAKFIEEARNGIIRPALAAEVKSGKGWGELIRSGFDSLARKVGLRMAAVSGPLGTMAPPLTQQQQQDLERKVNDILNYALQPARRRNKAGSLIAKVIDTPGGKKVRVFVPFDPEDMASFYAVAREFSAAKASVTDKLYEYWINWPLLSGPQTQVANLTGNAANVLWHYTAQRMVEAGMNTLYRDPNSAKLGEFKHVAKAFMGSIMPALDMARQSFLTEGDSVRHKYLGEPMEIEFKDGSLDKVGAYRPSIGGKAGQLARLPGRLLRFTDAFFKTSILHMEATAIAYRAAAFQAKQQGLTGKNRDAFLEAEIANALANPGSQVWAEANKTAEELLFQDENAATDLVDTILGGSRSVRDLEKLMAEAEAKGDNEGAAKLRNRIFWRKVWGKIMRIIFPFQRTPTNIIKVGLRKAGGSAVVGLWHAARAGLFKVKDGEPFLKNYTKAMQIKDVSESLLAGLGWMMLASMFEGDDDDEKKPILIVGNRPYAPGTQGEREAFLRSTGGANSILFRDKDGKVITSFNFSRYEPVATLLSAWVDGYRNYMEVNRRRKQGEADASYLRFIGSSLLASVEGKSFLQGFSGVMETIRDFEERRDPSTSNWAAKQFINSAIPNLIKQPLRNWDDLIRDTKTAGIGYTGLPNPEVAPKLPIFAAEPKITATGERMRKEYSPPARLLFQANTVVKPQPDALLLRANRLNPVAAWYPQPLQADDYYVREPGAKRGTPGYKTPIADPAAKRRFAELDGKLYADAARRITATATPAERAKPTESLIEKFKKAREQARAQARVMGGTIGLQKPKTTAITTPNK